MTELDLAIERSLVCSYTLSLENLDDSRDDLLEVMEKQLEFTVSASVLDKTKADQAKVVAGIRNNFPRDMGRLWYQDESGNVNAMLGQFQTIPGAVEESGMAPIISLITTVENKFDVLFNQKISAADSTVPVRRLKEIREDISDTMIGSFFSLA